MYIYIYTHVYKYIYMYIYMYMYIYIHMYIDIHVYIFIIRSAHRWISGRLVSNYIDIREFQIIVYVER